MRVRITKNDKGYKRGDVVDVSRNVAFGLVDSGIGIISKDMTEQDYKTNRLDEEQADGKPTKLRSVQRSRR